MRVQKLLYENIIDRNSRTYSAFIRQQFFPGISNYVEKVEVNELVIIRVRNKELVPIGFFDKVIYRAANLCEKCIF